MQNPNVIKLLDKIKEIHGKKNKDYSSHGFYENFHRSAMLAEWFNDSVDKAFVVLIGTKLARLATLLSTNIKPNNESIDDSFLDLTTYCALWASYHVEVTTGKIDYQANNSQSSIISPRSVNHP